MGNKIPTMKGFTLLEVLVSLAVLSATLILAYQVTSGAIAAADRSEAWTTASLLGEQKLREATETFSEVQVTEGNYPSPHERYSWRLTVKESLHSDAREVQVTVKWKKDGIDETLTLSGVSVR